MLNGLKNFAIKRILRHIADNPKLNKATNILALIPLIITALLTTNADIALLISGSSHPTPAFWLELSKVIGTVGGTACLWFTGKWKWLTNWKPVADAIIAEAQREIETQAKSATKG